MKLRILAVGKVKEKWLLGGIAEYSKRIGRFATLEITEVADSPDNLSPAMAMKSEGERLLARLVPSDFVVLIDLHGHEPDSEGFAELLAGWQERSGGRLVFVIAGSQGFDPQVIERAQARVCLSKLTFPHQMVRLILVEQIYRAYKINAGETYHK